ncbi:MAG: hypothetical protein AUH13_28010 [Acidobacteria bacterium 13_2_20CM_58_27]|nr:MAG: hypothetical protein AUH13_28010 [Acidobacteria bacterium 13_2_20CM_58_27]
MLGIANPVAAATVHSLTRTPSKRLAGLPAIRESKGSPGVREERSCRPDLETVANRWARQRSFFVFVVPRPSPH